MEDTINELQIQFWQEWDFWINLILAVVGIVLGAFSIHYSVKSFKEAKDAKDAAQKAGKTVRKQDIIVVLTELLNECQIPESIQFFEATSRHRMIHRRINHIKGLYSSDFDDTQKGFFANIEASLETIKSTLGLFNPTITPDTDNMTPELLFMHLDPIMTDISGHIEALKGTLQESLI